MASEFSFDSNYLRTPYSGNGIYHCDQCNQRVPFRSVEDHFKFKHSKVEQFEQKVCNGPNNTSPNLLDYEPTTLDRYLSNPADVRQEIEKTGPQDIFAYDSSNSKNKKTNADDSGLLTSSTPKAEACRGRLMAKFSEPPNPMKPNRSNSLCDFFGYFRKRSKIPTALELFENHPNFRVRITKKAIDDDSSTENTTQLPRARSRRSSSKARTQAIPEHFDQCRKCLNLMPKVNMHSHFERQHSAKNIEKLSKTKVNVPLIRMNQVTGGTSKGNKSPNVEQNNGQFVRCKLCNSHMHIDYMPGHLVRKHRSEPDGSCGIVWVQHTEEKMNQLLMEKRLNVKNGILFIKGDESVE